MRMSNKYLKKYIFRIYFLRQNKILRYIRIFSVRTAGFHIFRNRSFSFRNFYFTKLFTFAAMLSLSRPYFLISSFAGPDSP